MLERTDDILPFMENLEENPENEATRPLVGVGVVFVRQGKVFLAKRQGSHGEATWASAGGHLESGESLEECARRESLEELGVTVGNLIFLCFSNIIAYDKHYLDIEFLGDIGNQEPVLAEPEAFSEYGWFDLYDLPQPLFKAVSYALDSVKSGRYYYPGN
ncbi:MAG: NUDIX domain-containing protein [Chloroflexi bacterium]|nr:NUDIX domain-containing protein [Chloroflexota bacterium]MDA1218470.1 NUDIX domain-containing protein [Chloroflexota bacterium]